MVFHESIYPFASSTHAPPCLDIFDNRVLPHASHDNEHAIVEDSVRQLNVHEPTAPIPAPSISTDSVNESSQVKRSSRVAQKSSYLPDYHCYLVQQLQTWPSQIQFSTHGSTAHALSDVLTYKKFSPSF